MTKKIKIKKAYIFAFAFVVLVVLLAISGTKSSKTDAKYFTEYVTGTATNFAAGFSGVHFFRINR